MKTYMKTWKNKEEPFRRVLGCSGLGLDDKFVLSFAVYCINSIFITSASLTFYTSATPVCVVRCKSELDLGFQ